MRIAAIAASLVLATSGCSSAEPTPEAPKAGPVKAAMFVYRGAGCTGRGRMATFEKLLGRPADGIVEFSERSDWAHMLSSINWALGCWDGTKYRLAQSVPMLMDKGTSLSQGAAGAYDAHFRALGELLVKKGHAHAYLRIGWEFNGGWYPWAAKQDPDAFKRHFRRIVTAMRSVPGQRFVIVWNPAQGEQQIAPDKAWPGDAYVDVVATDLYNQSWNPLDKLSAERRWKTLVEQSYGLAWITRFAREHKKPLALPEWGTGTRPDGKGFGDDPYFIEQVAAFARANRVVFTGYWDYNAGDYNAELSNGRQPRSAAAFRRHFGRR
jgi:hypothetical protein